MAQRLLFGNAHGGGTGQGKYLVEFRAGMCTQKDKLVTPDKRKGMVYVHQTADSLIHLCWKDRGTGRTEEDLIIFPGDAEFEKVPQCTTGRVFVLKFKSNNKRCFFWMQEPKADKDEEYRTKVSQLLNGTSPQTRSGGASGFGNSITELTDDRDINQLISGMSQRDLIQIFNGLGANPSNINALLGRGSSSAGRSSSTSVSRSGSGTGSELQNVSSGAAQAEPMDTDETPATATGVTSASSPQSTGSPSAASESTGKGIRAQNLADILNKVNAETAAAAGANKASKSSLASALCSPDALMPLLNNTELMERVKDLLPPTTGAAADAVPDISAQFKTTVKSPQFQQAVTMFSAALASGQMGPLMTQFGLSDEVAAAAASGNMDDFVKALERTSKAKDEAGTTSENVDKDAESKE